MAQETTVGVVESAVLAYTAGSDCVLDLALVEADCLGTAAHVRMLSRMPGRGVGIAPADADRVVAELRRLAEEGRAGKFVITAADQDVHLAIERRLTEVLGDLGKRVHTCRSRNDQVAVDLRLWARERLAAALDGAGKLAETLLAWGRRYERVPMVGRTHLQPAMPSSVGLWASAVAESLCDDAELLETAARLNNRCPLGSAASYGVPLPIDRELTSRLLRFERPVHNVLHANQSRGKLESVILSALGQVMLTLSRFAQDMVLFTMPEFGYFTLPAAYTTGSSIMPQKRNPDVMELLRAKAAKVLSHAQFAAEVVRAMPAGYNRDLQEVKGAFMDGMDTTLATLAILPPLLEGTTVNEDALRAGFSPAVYATDRALELVAEGTPFRDAYREVKAHLGDLERRDPDLALAAKTHLGAPLGLDWEALGARAAEVRRRAAAWRALHDECRRGLFGADETAPGGVGEGTAP